jgi:hypothetical protein
VSRRQVSYRRGRRCPPRTCRRRPPSCETGGDRSRSGAEAGRTSPGTCQRFAVIATISRWSTSAAFALRTELRESVAVSTTTASVPTITKSKIPGIMIGTADNAVPTPSVPMPMPMPMPMLPDAWPRYTRSWLPPQALRRKGPSFNIGESAVISLVSGIRFTAAASRRRRKIAVNRLKHR